MLQSFVLHTNSPNSSHFHSLARSTNPPTSMSTALIHSSTHPFTHSQRIKSTAQSEVNTPFVTVGTVKKILTFKTTNRWLQSANIHMHTSKQVGDSVTPLNPQAEHWTVWQTQGRMQLLILWDVADRTEQFYSVSVKCRPLSSQSCENSIGPLVLKHGSLFEGETVNRWLMQTTKDDGTVVRACWQRTPGNIRFHHFHRC